MRKSVAELLQYLWAGGWKMLLKSILILVGLSTNPLFAGESLSLGIPTARGTGCPSGTIGAALSPDNSQLSVLFDEYTVEAREKNAIEKKDCDIKIPVRVPAGMRFSVLRMDFRGYNHLPKNANAALVVDYSLGSNHSRPARAQFKGELDAEYTITDKLLAHELHWTPCGKDVVLHIDTSIKVKTNKDGEQALSTLDSVDVSSNSVLYQISLQKCKGDDKRDERRDDRQEKREERRDDRDKNDDRATSSGKSDGKESLRALLLRKLRKTVPPLPLR